MFVGAQVTIEEETIGRQEQSRKEEAVKEEHCRFRFGENHCFSLAQSDQLRRWPTNKQWGVCRSPDDLFAEESRRVIFCAFCLPRTHRSLPTVQFFWWSAPRAKVAIPGVGPRGSVTVSLSRARARNKAFIFIFVTLSLLL
jgi:hypothetical protein